MLKKSWQESQKMCAADEVRSYLHVAAGPRGWGDTIERLIERGSRALGLTPARGFAYHYGKVKRPPADEVDAIRARFAQLSASQQKIGQLIREQHERLEAMAAARRNVGRAVCEPSRLVVVADGEPDRGLDQASGRLKL